MPQTGVSFAPQPAGAHAARTGAPCPRPPPPQSLPPPLQLPSGCGLRGPPAQERAERLYWPSVALLAKPLSRPTDFFPL